MKEVVLQMHAPLHLRGMANVLVMWQHIKGATQEPGGGWTAPNTLRWLEKSFQFPSRPTNIPGTFGWNPGGSVAKITLNFCGIWG